MTKLLQLIGVALFSVIAFATTVLSRPAIQTKPPLIAPDVPPSAVRSTAVDEPVCYFQTANGRSIDLSKLCDSFTESTYSPQVTYPQPPKVYDQKAVQAFDESLYGPNN